MPNWPTQLIGVILLVLPLVAIQWNLAGTSRRRRNLLTPLNPRSRWRLEIYANEDGLDVEAALADPADVPFPVRRVRSAKAERARSSPGEAWTLPRLELDVDVDDPLADESLSGLLSAGYTLRFVTGNEAVVDTGPGRLRIRALRPR
jgi:hypothetical protein